LEGPEDRFLARFGLDFYEAGYAVLIAINAVLIAALWYFAAHRFGIAGLDGFTILEVLAALFLSACCVYVIASLRRHIRDRRDELRAKTAQD
jgi:hypothetical protein